MVFKQESAQTLALQALGWLAAQDEAFDAFLAASGLGRDDLRSRAGDAEVLGAVLDFLLSDEALLLQFCADSGLRPDAPMQARAALPGGDAPFWT